MLSLCFYVSSLQIGVGFGILIALNLISLIFTAVTKIKSDVDDYEKNLWKYLGYIFASYDFLLVSYFVYSKAFDPPQHLMESMAYFMGFLSHVFINQIIPLFVILKNPNMKNNLKKKWNFRNVQQIYELNDF